MVYDHFLAKDSSVFREPDDIDHLTSLTYQDLDKHIDWLPATFIPVYRSMREHNWLGLYGNDWAVKRSFDALVRRSRYMTEADTAFSIFLRHRESMKEAYENYFPSLQSFSKSILEQLLPGE